MEDLKDLPAPLREAEPAEGVAKVPGESSTGGKPVAAVAPAAPSPVAAAVAATAPVGAKPTKSALPPYLHNNSWEEELNYKLWVTSSARFRADKRCCLRARWSQLSVTLLTSYLIIIGILPLLPQPLGKLFPADVLSFTTTAVSIILLAYSLIESSNNYSLKAHRHHECGLKIGCLYTRLRRAKEIADPDRKLREIDEITEEYQKALEAFENHEPIDYATFQTTKPDYFKLSKGKCRSIWIRYYFQTLFVYHVLIVTPPALIAVLVFTT